MTGESAHYGLIRCFENVLEKDLLLRVLEQADSLARSPNYWVKKVSQQQAYRL